MFKNIFNKLKFRPVPQNEDCESLLKDEEEQIEKRRKTRPCSPLIQTIFLLLALASSAFLGACFGSEGLVNRDSVCAKHISQYSPPLLKDIDINYSTIRFNGTLMHENIYRQNGSPEVDAAWQALGVDYRSAIIPSSIAAKAGLLPSQVQVQEKYGGGYPANVEGLHHLHCLNLLRQSLWFNYDYYHRLGQGAFLNEDRILRVHVTHCLDILRQQLMCTVDIGVLGQVWWKKDQPQAFVDFNTEHKCKNFDAVRLWAFDRQAPEHPPMDYLKRPKIGDVLDTMP